MARKIRSTEIAVPARLAVALPGETSVDDAVVNGTVSEINRILTAGKHLAARQIGELLLDRFFDGSLSNARARKGKHATFLAVAASEDLDMSASALWYCVAVHEQFTVLAQEVFEALSLGHHRHLAHVQDVDKRIALAKKAVDEDLSVRALKAAIDADAAPVPPGTPRRGRPAHPAIVKNLKAVTGSLEALECIDLAAHGKALDEAGRSDAVADARQLRDRFATWVSSLEAALARA